MARCYGKLVEGASPWTPGMPEEEKKVSNSAAGSANCTLIHLGSEMRKPVGTSKNLAKGCHLTALASSLITQR